MGKEEGKTLSRRGQTVWSGGGVRVREQGVKNMLYNRLANI
jgi:hypothetical protein